MSNDERQAEFLRKLEPVYARLSRYALAVTRDESDAEDLVSSTVLIAFEQFAQFDEASPAQPAFRWGANTLHYLVTIASRLQKRKRYRERNRVQYDEERAASRVDTASQPDIAADIRLMMDALATLPPRTRETVVLFEISDFTLEEIREVQSGTLSGVKSRLRRGREQLARALGVEADTGDRTSTNTEGAKRGGASRTPFIIIKETYVH